MINIKKIESRQMPKTINICSSKEYFDILYAWLQENSEWDGEVGHPRYIPKKKVKFGKIAEELGRTRQTWSTRFKTLLNSDLKLITEEGDRYVLSILPSEIGALIPYPTLKLMVDTLSDRVISVYIHLLLRYIAEDEQPFIFTYGELKRFIGISDATRSNDDTIFNILFVLKRLGLIDYEMTTSEGSISTEVRTVYRLTYLTNFIDKKC